MIDCRSDFEARRALGLRAAAPLDHPLLTLQQHVAWENAHWRVESNLVRNVVTLEEQSAVRIARASEPLYTAIIVPLARDGSLYLLNRYRYAISCWSMEFPRSEFEGGEAGWRAAAEADLLRLTGLEAEWMALLGAVHVEPAVLATSSIVILAEGCRLPISGRKSRAARQADPQNGQDELISRLTALPLSEVTRLVRQGEIACGLTLAALALYQSTVR